MFRSPSGSSSRRSTADNLTRKGREGFLQERGTLSQSAELPFADGLHVAQTLF